MEHISISSLASFIWSVADLLRGDFKQSQYGRIILPFTVLRRLECVLEATKDNVLAQAEATKALPENAREKLLLNAAGQNFYNASPLNLNRLGENNTGDNLDAYVRAFSTDAREIFEHFNFVNTIYGLDDANILYQVVKKFREVDLSPEAVDNYHMGLVFEELIRRFAESSNETAGEHFTPRDIVRLTTSLVFSGDDVALTKPGVVRSIYDPTAGTGGFLSSGMEYLKEINENARLATYGQELNPESYAICKADMLIKGQDISNIKLGNTLSDDQLEFERFDYCLSNPPFGVDWKKVEKRINDEHKLKGFNGRFGAGLPRVSDGSLLFLMHLISKMKPVTDKSEGSRIGIILNGSPLFTGGAGSGESEIRRYILERDLLDALIALPTDMFYNTGIATYIWVLSNHKPAERKGKVLLINASDMHSSMRKSLGSKRKFLDDDAINTIVDLYSRYEQSPIAKIFNTTDFGYRRITVERPLKLALYPHDAERLNSLQQQNAWAKLDAELQQGILSALAAMPLDKYLSRDGFKKAFSKAFAAVSTSKLPATVLKLIFSNLGEQDDTAEVCKTKGEPEPATELRDNENVPLNEDIEAYFKREVLPHVPDAWIDTSKTDPLDGKVGLVGYEIPFNRHFYQYQPPRSLEAIDADLDAVAKDIMSLLSEVHS
ncbi:restriction endonuclease subunit M [Shewanella xiamenensis]|uniref:type I restriction-modification system subunit M n=1 Tax=Shewanella xiamenensis TaxID=332186 RepID=UPI0011855AD5|nr:class I SAM-dependent DNA methyltransferase [Shewanella xiamenensis]TVL21123.1 restriction endonuclease subunit M [Shewanella xiamenensis]TVL21384.1 restriction endonuclease subunit M [Shewanella xiamenensis]TVL27331.1 restriction endonuclease subunit M [Shewanella xiamenensis]TVL34878.1 restriction endonuclease subunit M [Shewanella xiamenensis]TVP03524.1 restriction endonuclease subunit M [Shewanella xiamenensis]